KSRNTQRGIIAKMRRAKNTGRVKQRRAKGVGRRAKIAEKGGGIRQRFLHRLHLNRFSNKSNSPKDEEGRGKREERRGTPLIRALSFSLFSLPSSLFPLHSWRATVWWCGPHSQPRSCRRGRKPQTRPNARALGGWPALVVWSCSIASRCRCHSPWPRSC